MKPGDTLTYEGQWLDEGILARLYDKDEDNVLIVAGGGGAIRGGQTIIDYYDGLGIEVLNTAGVESGKLLKLQLRLKIRDYEVVFNGSVNQEIVVGREEVGTIAEHEESDTDGDVQTGQIDGMVDVFNFSLSLPSYALTEDDVTQAGGEDYVGTEIGAVTLTGVLTIDHGAETVVLDVNGEQDTPSYDDFFAGTPATASATTHDEEVLGDDTIIRDTSASLTATATIL